MRTVQRLLSGSDLPETASLNGSLGRSLLEPYKQSLLEWWNAQIRQPQVLMILLQQKGYTGSARTLTRYLSAVRAAQGLPPTRVKPIPGLAQVIDPQSPPLTKSRVAYLIVKRVENRDSNDTKLLTQIVAQHSALALAVELADEFLRLLRQQRAEDLRLLKVRLSPLFSLPKVCLRTTLRYSPV